MQATEQFYDEALDLLFDVVEENPQRSDLNDTIASLQRMLENQQPDKL